MLPGLRREAQMAHDAGARFGYLTVECGTPDDIRRQVRGSMAVLAAGGGFTLSPVTNVRADTPRVWRNVEVLIET